ncbi:SRPBCC family protein [Nesterenkonia sp. CF4.4]|uniref:SRPBCC family protein n=1 Tax=Nesterenkonia sp. CF4.4 TaxID=3373079 RepID=UPI003EE48283
MSTTVSTSITIDAPPMAVWETLTDFRSYQKDGWNPFIRSIEGTPEVGNRLVVHLRGNGGRGMRFTPTLLAAEPGRELRWIGKLGLGGILDGEHSFFLTSNDDGTTHLVHSERFTGILASLMKGTTDRGEAGFAAFNESLKHRVETGSAR